ncbi:MAG: hypothetical protein FWD61_08070 [Phycisphaerales bacterium]|nr:hypothetical protein [Phycisphaerales bacterium]
MMPEQEGNVIKLDPGPPLTDEESTQKALNFIKTNPRLWLAKIRCSLDGPFNWIRFIVPADTHLFYRNDAVRDAMRICRWLEHYKDIEHCRVVAEIYKTSRKASLIIRIVRRGSSRRYPDKRYNLAQWYLRLAREPMVITQSHYPDLLPSDVDLLPSDTETETESLFKTPNPIAMLRLAENSTRCTVDIPGCEVDVSLMRYGDKFAKIKGGGVRM